MRFFYIDTENRHAETWANRLGKLKRTDVVYILYTSNSARMPVEMFPLARKSLAELKVVESVTGVSNALDFTLTTVMAQKTVTAPKSAHIIISADKGYDAVVSYLTKRGIYALRAPTIPDALKTLQGTKY